MVRNIEAHGEIDILRGRRQVLAKGCIPFHDPNHVGGANPTLDQDLRRTKGTGRENDSPLRRQRNDTIRPQASVVRADPGDFGTIANDAVNRSPHLQLEVPPGPRRAEVRSNRSCTLPALELSRKSRCGLGGINEVQYIISTPPIDSILVVWNGIDGDIAEASELQETGNNIECFG